MDYRLVRQFYNNAIDNFFNVFYKIGDFSTIMIDVFWAFWDIWYQLFMMFANFFLYIYYIFLYLIDRVSMSRSPLFFWRKSYGRRGAMGDEVVVGDYMATISPKFGKHHRPVAPAVTSSEKPHAASRGTMPQRTRVSGRSFLKVVVVFIKVIMAPFYWFFKGIFLAFKESARWLAARLKPIREDEVKDRKTLVEQYMKEFEQKNSM